MSKIILVILIFGGITFWWHWSNTPDPKQRKQFVQKTLIWVLVIGSLLLVVTGRMHWLGAVFAGMLAMVRQAMPLVIRYFPMFTQLYRSFAPRARAQNTSTVSTKFIEMTLDHESGALSGKVLAGEFKGRFLSELDNNQLSDLYEFCKVNDMDSARLLENYLTERFGRDNTRTAGAGENRSMNSSGEMSVSEALQILGLEGSPGPEEITTAYRKIMQRLHPDRGGNQYFAAKANQARKVLLNKFG